MEVKEKEEETFENLSEGFQSGAWGKTIKETICTLEEAESGTEEIIESLGEL